VLYVASRFPVLSETFVYREVEALRAAGMRVEVATLRPAPQEPVTRTLVERFAGLVPVYGDNKTAVVSDALLEAICHPVRLAGTAAVCARDFVRGKLNIRDRLLLLVQLVAACALARRARRLQVRHLHAHMANAPTTIAMYTAMQLGTSFSFTGHANSLFARRALLAEKLRRAAFVACISEWHRKFYRDFTPVSDERSPIVRCGVDAGFLRQVPTPVPDVQRFVLVGALVEQKGHLILLRALKRLRDGGEMVEVVCAGDGHLRGVIESEAKRLGIADMIRITGWISNSQVRDELRQSRALVMSSLAENLPVAMMEAMAMGRPVIGTQIAGIPELIVPGQTGWVVAAGSPEAIADAMRECLRMSIDQLSKMGERAANRVAELHDADHEASKMAALFRSQS